MAISYDIYLQHVEYRMKTALIHQITQKFFRKDDHDSHARFQQKKNSEKFLKALNDQNL